MITHPGAAVEPIDQVIWWQLSMPVLPTNYPWSASEIRALHEAGVHLPSAESLLNRAADEWLRPIFAARKQVVLVLPPKGEEVHPVWQMIEAVVEEPAIATLEDFLRNSSKLTRPVTHAPLPQLRRWWQLPKDLKVPLRRKESFSSLELMLFNPYHWLLKYPAALRVSRIISLNDDFRILGTLAHDLVDRFYRQADALKMTEGQFTAWFDPAFDQLIREEGATLLMPGKGVDLEGFRNRLFRSVRILREQMAKARVLRVAPEMSLNGVFRGGELSGFADLVMNLKDGSRAVIDMKWSGSKKYPEKLQQNRHLQLAIYAELLRQGSGDWPVVAYYILDRARFFTPNDHAFPDADVIVSDSGENTAQLWQRFLASWTWRKTQFESGLFEVALESVEGTDLSNPPNDGMDPEYLNESYNEFRALAGWGF